MRGARRTRALHPQVIEAVRGGVERSGGFVSERADGLLLLNGELSLSIAIARCRETSAGGLRWRFGFDLGLSPDVTVAIRMAPGDAQAQDYFLFPSLDLAGARLRLAEDNGLSIDAYRFDDLDELFVMSERIPFAEAA